MESQPIVNKEMRAKLMGWLIGAHTKLKLMPESIYLTISIMDSYLSKIVIVSKKDFVRIGVSSMLIACKYEDISPPDVNHCIN